MAPSPASSSSSAPSVASQAAAAASQAVVAATGAVGKFARCCVAQSVHQPEQDPARFIPTARSGRPRAPPAGGERPAQVRLPAAAAARRPHRSSSAPPRHPVAAEQRQRWQATPTGCASGDAAEAQDGRRLLNIALGPGRLEDAADMLGELAALEQRCRQQGRLFEDAEFALRASGRATRWCRPWQIQRHDGRPLGGKRFQFFGETLPLSMRKDADWCLFRDAPRTDDVLQGELGDCWFLSSLAVLADFQSGRFVRALLPGQPAPGAKLSRAGVYLVRLCLGGRWYGVLVDDRLPCIGGGPFYRQLAYCVTHRLQLWASIIEKAFAKVCGSYEAIQGGEAADALTMLTGFPCSLTIFDPRWNPRFDRERLWAQLRGADEAGFLMTCSTRDCPSKSLVQFHVYSLLRVCELPGARGPLRLLKIRNPHNKVQWDGDWSERSPLWTPQLRALVFGAADQQVFCMGFDDFLKQFAHATICRVRAKGAWHDDRVAVELPRLTLPQTALLLRAVERTECTLSLAQPEERLRQGPFFQGLEGRPLACLGLALFEAGASGLGRCAAAAPLRCAPAATLDVVLERGRPLVLVPLSRAPTRTPATFVCSAPGRVAVREYHLEAFMLARAWAGYARATDPQGIRLVGGAALFLGRGEGGSVVALVENPSSSAAGVELTLSGEGLSFARGGGTTLDWLPPGHGQIVQVALPVAEGSVTRWKHDHRSFVAGQPPQGDAAHRPPVGAAAADPHAPFSLGDAAFAFTGRMESCAIA